MNGKWRTLIVDDEPSAREKSRTLLGDDKEIEVIGECGDGNEAVDSIRAENPNLVFLDIQMPGQGGFGVIAEIGAENMPVVVFVTAFDQYAIRAFEVHALDYRLKPFDRGRFEKALDRARKHLAGPNGKLGNRLIELLGELKSDRRFLERLVIKESGRVFFFKTSEILWIEAAGNYVRLHLDDGAHLMRETMNRLEERLDPDRFLRIHRSTIVNVDEVRELQPMFNGEYEVILKNGTELNLSRGYRENSMSFRNDSARDLRIPRRFPGGVPLRGAFVPRDTQLVTKSLHVEPHGSIMES